MPNVAMLQTTADLAASQTAGGIASLVPTGTVFAYAGTSAPTGWLTCNGTAISRTTYADLFSAIGVAHGYGDNSTTFNLPDYRGRFIRGGDAMFGGTAATRDPDRAGRTAANTGGNTGNAVGSVQTEATKKNGLTATGTVDKSQWNNDQNAHTHNAANSTMYNYTTGGVLPISGGTRDFNNGQPASSASNANWNAVNATAVVTIGAGDNETRPQNAYVNYIIKI